SRGGLIEEPVEAVAGALLLAERQKSLVGHTIGAYTLLSRLGKGGMGEVFEAEDTRLKRKVAIKFLSEDLARNPSALERFQREAQSIARLNHPNICTVHDVGEHQGRPFLVMELLTGETLDQRLKRGPIPARELVELASQLAGALAAAHGQGILHRDL